MKAIVDPDLCIGCGVCPNLAPDVFEMNDDGIAEAKVDTVPAEFEDVAKEAAEECPSEAITIEE
jgi:ferredoxin